MLALRPADAAETSVAWKMAMENTETPTALVLSRQNINDLPAATDRYTEALKAEKGAYIVQKNGENPKVILIASGSEVATLIDAAKLLLERKGIASQVVSAISEGLFRQQPTAYQEEVIPASTPHFGLTAGLSVTLEAVSYTHLDVYKRQILYFLLYSNFYRLGRYIPYLRSYHSFIRLTTGQGHR